MASHDKEIIGVLAILIVSVFSFYMVTNGFSITGHTTTEERCYKQGSFCEGLSSYYVCSKTDEGFKKLGPLKCGSDKRCHEITEDSKTSAICY